MSERYRNHPVVLVKSAFRLAAAAFLILLWVPRDSIGESLVAVGMLMAAIWCIRILVWRRTWISFDENGIGRIRDKAVTKHDAVIPYTRLASVGVSRTVIDRLFGTTALQFNVNSGVDATGPEATLVLRSEEADRVRDELNRRVFVKEGTVEDEREVESIVGVSNAEILMHAFLSQSTPSLIWAVMLLAYTAYSLMSENSGGLLVSFVMLFVSEVFPIAKKIMVYGNYRLYRIGDTVTVESGLFTTSRRSFRISRINSVRIRMPLLARIMGKATLEAEVVGLQTGGDDTDKSPLLCPLKPLSEVKALTEDLIPEAVFDPEEIHQPASAAMPTALPSIVFAAVCAIAVAIASLCGCEPTAVAGLSAVCAVLAVLAIGWSFQAQRWRSIAIGPVSFMVSGGGYDRSVEYILYDKVQKTVIISGPLQRRAGVAALDVSLLASSGFRSLSSGLFDPAVLERIPSEVVSRIRDGRYDWKMYLRSKVHLERYVSTLERESLLVDGDLPESELAVQMHGMRASSVRDDDDPSDALASGIVQAGLQASASCALARVFVAGGELHYLPVPVVPRCDHATGHGRAVIRQGEEYLATARER